MTLAYEVSGPRPAHPLHAILIGFPIALFASGLAADIAYYATAEMQWSNFASWLIAGGLVFGGFALLWALVSAIAGSRRPDARNRFVYLILVALMWIAGFVNAFNHSQDAWSSVGVTGLLLSAASTVAALAAGWTLFTRANR